jgi:hypothetical protein
VIVNYKRFQVVKFENSPRNHSMIMMSKNKYMIFNTM